MVTLKFPPLNKALTNPKEIENELSPEKGISVFNNVAIIYTDTMCILVDLYDYFTIDCDIQDQNEIDELERILFFMNGKTFSAEYWTEITKGANMKVMEGNIFIETPKYSKDLFYKHIDVDHKISLSRLIKAKELQTQPVDEISVSFGDLLKLYSIIGTPFKDDDIILSFNDQDTYVKFTFRKRKYITGYFYPNYMAAVEGFKYELLGHFVDGIKLFYDELKSLVPEAPPVPEIVQDAIDEAFNEADNKPDLFKQ